MADAVLKRQDNLTEITVKPPSVQRRTTPCQCSTKKKQLVDAPRGDASVLAELGHRSLAATGSKAALETLGVWASVSHKVAPAEDVRAALLLVSRGETPLGIVYATDAAADKGVRVVATFPDNTHPPIRYPVAVLAASTNPGAMALLGFLKSERARPFFEQQGFAFRP